MQYAFEDKDNLYLVIDLMNGGDLRYHIGKYRRFTEEQTSKVVLFILICRVFYGLYAHESRILAQELHIAQRHQARKFSFRSKWIYENHRPWYCESLEP